MKENWLNVVSFKTELLTESIIHKGYRESLPKLLPKLPPFRNRMIIDNDIYIDLSETSKIQEFFSKDIVKKASEVYDKIETQSQKLISVAKESIKEFDSKITNEEIISKLKNFFTELQNTIGAIGVPTIIDLELESQIKEILKKNNINNIDSVFPHLAVSFKPVETAKEKDDLFDIAVKIQNGEISFDSKELKDLIKNHYEEYGWIHSTLFLGELYSGQNILDEIKSIDNSKDEKVKLERDRKDHLLEAEKIIDKIELEEDKEKVRFLQEAVFYRTARLEWMNKACFIVRPLLDEVGVKLRVSFDDVIYMLQDEIYESLKKGEIKFSLLNQIKERHKGYAYISDNTNEYLLVTSDKLEEWKEKFSHKHEDEIIKGIVTCKGEAKGKVVIVKDRSELHKVENGDILVTRLTTPDFVVAMRKSKGIVTDLGGITSHAAVTSRELGIPCIVGTKNATKVLNDGDLVELDMEKGIVKLLEKKK